MPHPCPHHCPPERGSGLGIIIAVAVLVAVVAAIRTAMPTIEHTAELAIEVLVIAVASVVGLAAIGATAYVAVRVHRSQATNRQAIAQQGRAGQAVSGPHRPAIAARRAPLYVITSEHRIEEEQ